jgi:hypothetical protein
MVALMGTTPVRDTSAMVGRRPTIALYDAGPMIEPVVSLPILAAAKLAAVAAPPPDELPPGLRVRSNGFFV